jgi:hypothetical protein
VVVLYGRCAMRRDIIRSKEIEEYLEKYESEEKAIDEILKKSDLTYEIIENRIKYIKMMKNGELDN